MAIIISYPISASGIIVLLKTPTKYREFFSPSYVKTTDFQRVFHFGQTRTVAIFGEHGIMAHIPRWLSQSAARFSKVPIINGPGKLSPFTLKSEVKWFWI